MNTGTETTGGEAVAEAGIGMIVIGIEEGTGIATKAGVAVEVLIMAKSVGEEDMTTIRAEVGLLTEVVLPLIIAAVLEGAYLHAEHLLGAEVL